MNKLTTKFKFDKNDDRFWSGVFGFRPNTEDEVEAQGEMFAVLSIGSDIDFDFEMVAGLLFDELQAEFYNTAEASLQQFELALRAVHNKVEYILAQEKELAKNGVDIQLAVVVLKDNTMYAAVVGETRIFVKRGEELAEISKVLADPDMDGFMRTGSMILEPEDRVLLATDSIDANNSKNLLQEELTKLELEEINVSRGAALLVGFEATVPAVKQVEPEPVVEAVVAEEPKPEAARNLPQSKPTSAVLERLRARDIEEEEQEPLDKDEYEDSLLRQSPKTNTHPEEEVFGTPVYLKEHTGENSVMKIINTAKEKLVGIFGHVRNRAGNIAQDPRVQERYSQLRHGGAGAAFGQVQNLLNKQWEYFRLYVLRRGDRSQLYRVQQSGERTRYLVAVAVILGLVLIFGIRQTVMENERQGKIKQLQDTTTRLSSRIDQLKLEAETASAQTLPENKQLVVDSLKEVKTQLEQVTASEVAPSTLKTQAAKLIQDATAAQDTALKVFAFTEPQIVNNLAANYQGSAPSDIAFAEGSVYVADPARNAVYKMATAINSSASVATTEVQTPYLITKDKQNDLVIIDKPTQGSIVTVLDTATNAVRRVTGLSAEKEGNLTAIDIWDNNSSIYSLNADKSSIIRQAPSGSNYVLPDYIRPWGKFDTLTAGRDLAVDGNVFVLIKGVGLKKFRSGQPADFTLQGMMPNDEQAVKNADAFELTDRYIYLADAANQRIFVFARDPGDEKIANYAGQYLYRGSNKALANIKDMVVNDGANQLFVLAGTQVVRIDLRNL